MSPEEVAAARTQMKEAYENQMPLLQSQLAYETLMADIEEQRARRATYTMRIAQIFAPEPEPTENPEGEPEQPVNRKLKKD